ncbi:ACX3 [Auxenochlorella protothecoides x Auxenochlorella symbiontica]
MAAQRRVAALTRHLKGDGEGRTPVVSGALCRASSADPEVAAVLYKFITRDNMELRQKIFDFLKDPIYQPEHYLSIADFRALTRERFARFAAAHFFTITDYVDNPRRFLATLECLAWADYSLAILSGVHYTLCGGTITKLGSAAQVAAHVPAMDVGRLRGCFGMTELGHGSDVAGIRTRASYDAATREFVLTTPDDDASKYWIGGAAGTAHICAVFAQLEVAGREEGVHVFLVPLRDEAGRPHPGVRTADCGAKMGLNGVDNGQIWLDDVRVPREAMLSRLATVSPEGRYSSALPDRGARFGATVGGLTMGRVLIAGAAVTASAIGLTVAINYAHARPQFGDTLIGDYLTHQRRLYPALAATYALHFALDRVKALLAAAPAAAAPLLRTLSALHALSCLEGAAAELALGGVLTRAGAESLRGLVNDLCRRLGEDRGAAARTLCAGFGCPDHLMWAPIARDWTTAFKYPGKA